MIGRAILHLRYRYHSVMSVLRQRGVDHHADRAKYFSDLLDERQ